MDPIGAVDIRAAGRAKHYHVSLGGPGEAVRGGVIMVVGFRLYNSSSDSIDEQRRADQALRHFDRWR